MILATQPNGSSDGQLILISPSRDGFARAPFATLQEALENWPEFIERAGEVADFSERFDATTLCAPLPRAWQWLDGSAFATHAELMQVAFQTDPIDMGRPLMYQGLSDRFYGPTEDVVLPSMQHGIDFEGEFGVIVDRVPMGISAEEAMQHIRLIVQINDWSLRSLAPVEMKTGFGWIQAKPASAMAPFAVTPDELGDSWKDGRVCLDLAIEWNGQRFGSANGETMLFGFHELVAHAAFSRELVAGTVIGSGTVSNANYAQVGSSCISEVRAIEMIADGKARTNFMQFGDRVRMEALSHDGSAPFGVIDQKVVPLG